MPYLFILFLGLGLLIVTLVSGLLQFVGTRKYHSPRSDAFTWPALKHAPVSGRRDRGGAVAYGNLPVMPVGRLSLRHALIGGATATLLWEITRHVLAWYYATMSQMQLVYGSLTTAVAVLLSVEFGALVLLLAKVIAEYERVSRAPLEAGRPATPTENPR